MGLIFTFVKKTVIFPPKYTRYFILTQRELNTTANTKIKSPLVELTGDFHSAFETTLNKETRANKAPSKGNNRKQQYGNNKMSGEAI